MCDESSREDHQVGRHEEEDELPDYQRGAVTSALTPAAIPGQRVCPGSSGWRSPKLHCGSQSCRQVHHTLVDSRVDGTHQSRPNRPCLPSLSAQPPSEPCQPPDHRRNPQQDPSQIESLLTEREGVGRDALISLVCLIDKYRTQPKRRQPEQACQWPTRQRLYERAFRHALLDFASLLLGDRNGSELACRTGYSERDEAPVGEERM